MYNKEDDVSEEWIRRYRNIRIVRKNDMTK